MRIESRLAWLLIIPLCALAAATSAIWLVLAAMYDPDGKRAWQLAEAFDRLANAAVGGSSRMTLSAHAGRESDRAWSRWLCRLLDRVDPGHCVASWEAWKKQAKK